MVKKLGGQSAKYFLEQQKSLGRVNGYIEEMINGQKVIKVFCHEEKCKEQFDALNHELRENAASANTFANILMPIMMNIGNLLYVLVAVVGGALALSGVVGNSITIGVIASFLQLTKSFTQPVTQISQQFNSIVMALAGAERIFELMDEEPEVDNGYVTLVNAKYDKNGELVETPEKTNIWAWKHPHEDGTTTYTQVRGDVRFFDVDFGYNPDKIVLHDITLYAEPGQKVAFVGATGAGKTTITNLINRFYDLADGKIRYDGININKIKKPIFAARSASFCRIPTCLPAPSAIISATVVWMRPTRKSRLPLSWLTRTTSSADCRTATIPSSTVTAAVCRRVSASCFPSRVRLLPIRRL